MAASGRAGTVRPADRMRPQTHGGYRWLLFDADGTLFDYDRAEAAALTATWREAGLPLPDALVDAYRRINGALWLAYEAGGIDQISLRVERFARLAGELEQAVDAEALSRIYLRQLSRQSELIAGARELLEDVRRAHELALITNGIPEVQRPRIRRAGFDALFPVVVISGEVGAAKPAPEIFDEAMRRMGGPAKREVLLIGDSLSSDIRGGVDYGLDTCWYNPGRQLLAEGGPRPDYEIHELAELRAILT